MPYHALSAQEAMVMLQKGTEPPFTGDLEQNFADGTYVCRQCDNPLFSAEAKFHSGCGWPSFEDHIPSSVVQQTDADGRRTEILCAHCLGHLGHVFHGEQFTAKNTRHCVNSLSLRFIPAGMKLPPRRNP